MSTKILSIEETQQMPGALLWRASKLWQNQMHAALADLGLSSTNSMVLSNMLHMEREDQKITQASLALVCNTDRMTISTIIRTLMTKGLVERKVDESDKRHLELLLTPDGRELAYEAVERITEMHENFFKSVSQENLAQLSAQLVHLLKANNENYRPVNHKDKEEE